MNNMQYILCSAIWYNDGKSYSHQPSNIESGYVIAGRRHHNCIITNYILFNRKTETDNITGFLTNDNKFVHRWEAAEIAYKAKQIKNRVTILMSEDLY